MTNLENHFKIKITQHLKKGERFGIAVSGGVDSMTLLYLLAKLENETRYCPVVLHFNHKLRGRSSTQDMNFVKQASKKYGFRCITAQRDTERWAQNKKQCVEEAARDLRYEFFKKQADQLGVKKILLAHHEDDLVETLLMRLFRGTGIRGLQAMSESSLRRGLTLIRPFLSISKKELKVFARKNSITFREDATNTQDKFFRNKIRQKIIPILERELGGEVKRQFLGFRNRLLTHQNYVDQAVSAAFKNHWKKRRCAYQVGKRQLLRMHCAIQYGTLSTAYQKLAGKTLEQKEWDKVQSVLRGETPQTNLRGNTFFRHKSQVFSLSR